MKYKVTLLDHNYVIAPQRKLILSVIGDMCVWEKDFSEDAVTYSGPKCKTFWFQCLSPFAEYEMHMISWYIQWQFQKWYWWLKTSHDSHHRWGSRLKYKIHKNYPMCDQLFHHPGLECILSINKWLNFVKNWVGYYCLTINLDPI